MIIAAHIPGTATEESPLFHCLRLLAEEKQETRFIFFTDEKWKMPAGLPGNIKCVVISPALKNGLLMHYWYHFKLPGLLKKYGAAHFISESGAVGLKIHIPQFMFLNTVSFLQKKPVQAQEYARYIKRYFPKFSEKATVIFVTENFIGDRLAEKYPAVKTKIMYAGHGLNSVYQPAGWIQKEKFLESFTGGTEYFIAECSLLTRLNILILVKAFSHFKKRLKSAMKLVLVLKGIGINDCIKDFHLYKYRDDVKIVYYTNDKEYAPVLAAAYGAIFLPREIIAENSGLHALAAGVPLVTVENTDALSVYGDAALYTSLSEKAIAENMMMLYKDEEGRKNHIEKGLNISAGYSWASAAGLIWQAIEDASPITT